MEHAQILSAGIATGMVVVSSASLLLSNQPKRKTVKKRRWWITSMHKSRERYNGLNMLFDMRKEPSGKFENFCCMSAEDFEIILNKIAPKIRKIDTNMRKAIPVQERLAITLRFLATGDSYTSLGYLFKISHQVISLIVPEVCEAIIAALQDEIRLPKSEDEWVKIATGFEQQWNFPHCVGAIDGKHIVLQAPFNTETEFFNYKKTFSIILMALVDSEYCFTFVDIGSQGRMNDAGVFADTTLYRKMIREELFLPPSKQLPGRQESVPYIFVRDDAFPLSTTLLKPYPGNHLKGSTERIFNYRLCRARRVVENVFGILSSVFRIFRAPILLQSEKAAKITMTCTLLHNFLRRSKTSRKIYSPNGTFDSEVDGKLVCGTWRKDNQTTSFTSLRKTPRKSSKEAKHIQEEFAEYFKTTGSVPWQNDIN